MVKRFDFLVIGSGIAGMRWSRYRLDEDKYFKETGGITSLHSAPEGIHYIAGKLNITSLAIPLLPEWQSKHRAVTV